MPPRTPHVEIHPAEPLRATASEDFRSAVLASVTRCSCAVTTSEVAMFVGRQPGRDSNRQHSAAVLQELCALEALRVIRRADDRMPIVWRRV